MRNKWRRNAHDDDHINETWLIPYADMLTLLLALFIVLYSISSLNTSRFKEMSQSFRLAFNAGFSVLNQSSLFDKGKAMERGRENLPGGHLTREQLREREQQNLEQLQRQLNAYIEQNGLQSQLETKLNHSELLITIRDNALFDSGSADVKPEARRLAVAISRMLEDFIDYEVVVAGHTDDRPIHTAEFASNWELSAKRAINFMKILLENPKFDPSRFSAIGYGEYRPIDPRDTEEARARNRRVEISLLRKYTSGDTDLPLDQATTAAAGESVQAAGAQRNGASR